MASVVVPMFEDQRAVVGHGLRHRRAQCGLARGVQAFTLGVRDVFHGGRLGRAPAVKAAEQPMLGQALHIAAHGLQRHARVSASCSTVADLRLRTSFSSRIWRGLVFTLVGLGVKYLRRGNTVKRKRKIKGKP